MYNDIGDNMNEFILPKEVEEQFYALETSLFKAEYLSDRDYLENIFHDNFMEYGKSGLVYRKKDTIDSLYNAGNRDITIEDFTCEKIDDKTYIVHYVSINSENIAAYRTSIWIDSDSTLQLYFHQGTTVNENSKRPNYF